MIDISTDYNAFDTAKLIDSTLKFAEDRFSPCFAIPWVYEENDSPEYCENAEGEASPVRDYVHELVAEKKLLFFTFSTNNVGKPIDCADGLSYSIDDNAGEDLDDGGFHLSDTECLGFLFEYGEGKLRIRSAINWSGACMCPGGIYVREELGIFEEPMKKYIDSFIRP